MAEPRPDRHVYLGMPGYGRITDEASRAFWTATRLPSRQVVRSCRKGSLLAANFNALWTHALNIVHHGERLDYFAMQHDDIAPADYWLDVLIDELEARDLDVLGVVAPIKDMHGTTSLALDRADRDTWRPLCRLTMAEVFQLPVTFTSADLGHPLLLNTGLWVCRFDMKWARKVHFTINDRIAFDTGRDAYVAQVEPEDWYFSRLCHELNLKVGATRKVVLNHRGEMDFANNRIWGESFDSAWVNESQLPKDPDGFVFPTDIEGWLTAPEGKALSLLAKDLRVLEVGSYEGLSTVCMARTARRVTSVDPHDGRGTAMPRETFTRFTMNLERYGVTEKVSAFIGPLSEFAESGFSDEYDLIFIDGDHDAEAVAADIEHALALLADGGVLAFHDYRSPSDPGVAVAVDHLLLRGGELVLVTDSLAVVKPPAAILEEV